ncbi:sulfotransferase family protein [Nocardioides sp. SYSU D00038]|uniref:sulfotransferase family protein n=1 Tax=Nocardioides sp. SYSU D00038 TaxID=2812554 RepID=UPI001967A270|nr:sulfotransferase family protein [Nocardioides sp. SYSU D00038]
MIISDSHQFLFVHVQKTGGTSIDRVLTPLLGDVRRIKEADRHAPLGRLLELEPALASYWTVGFVRNPWARMLSWWRMIERFRDGAAAGNQAHIRHLERNRFVSGVLAEHADFESFVLHAPEKWRRLRVPQSRYLHSPTRRADLVGRQETLDQDMNAVLARLGLPYEPLPRINVDLDRPSYRDVYSPAARRRVAELFEADIRAFAYEF